MMQDTPAVSFCMTTYKRRDFLRQQLETIGQQTFRDFEVVICDNDPEASAQDVVASFGDSRFRYFHNGENLGMIKSFNRSIEKSRAEYIVMITDDDPAYPDMLETLMALKKQYPGYGMYMGASNWVLTDPIIAKLYNVKEGVTPLLSTQPEGTITTYTSNDFLQNFFNKNIFPYYLWSTGFIRRDILIERGGVPDYGTAFMGDFAYLALMGSHSGAVILNRALGHQTIHTHNYGRAQNEQIRIAATNFVQYVGDRIKQVEGWPDIEKKMYHFVAVWILSHLSFLHHYSRLSTDGKKVDLRPIEREVFAIPFMKPYYLKYWLKTHMPLVHDWVVAIKKKLVKQN